MIASSLAWLYTDIVLQVVEFVYAEGMAFRYPEPVDKDGFVRATVWDTQYDSFLPDTYDWPGVNFSPKN